MQVQPFYDFNICQHEKFIGIAPYGHALAMAGQFITFCRNVCTVNEQKVEIFILLLNSVFSAGTDAQ
jgi:hypothetical protein